MLTLENIDVTLAQNTLLERKVLSKLNLKIAPGEFVVIIGGNGAGKSTLFNLISGFIKPASGKILIDGKNVTEWSQRSRSGMISKVMQDPKIGTMEKMTIYENMAFAFKRGQTRGLTLFATRSREALFKEKLRLLGAGLENRLDDLVSNLSGGQRQSLSVVMALLQESKILLLDEITAALDPSSSDAIMDLTNRIIRQQNLSCIMITHDMGHALKYGDRLLLLKNGSFIKEYSQEAKSKMSMTDLTSEFQLI